MLATVKRLLYDLPLQDLLDCKGVLNDAIDAAYAKDKEKVVSSEIDDYVEYNNNFIHPDSVHFANLEADLASLNLSGKKGGTNKCWLTTTNLPYTWKSGRKDIKNKPVDITQFGCINKILLDLNKKYDIDLNSCLVTYYKDGNSNLRLHHDGEKDMDSSEPICVVTVGAVRTVEFLGRYQHWQDDPLLSLNPASGSLYVMNPGCQDIFRHRVVANNTINKERYSLSFRKRVVPDKDSDVNRLPVTIESEILYNSVDDSVVTKSDRTLPDRVCGAPKIKRTTVLFGTSITSGVEGNRLAHRGRRCINISQSGAKISDISDMVDNFRFNHADAPDIEKVIFSFGTNDVKSNRVGIGKLRQPIWDLIEKTKRYFPGCIVYVQCVLPIGRKHWFTAPNVLDFNQLLRDICHQIPCCMYIDCFWDFVLKDRSDHNYNLFKDWLHLNKLGVGILCRWLKYVINSNVFNPIISGSYLF